VIDLNQAEIICKRIEMGYVRTNLGFYDLKEILTAEHQALKWFPELVEELKIARDRIRKLEDYQDGLECV
jgi:hypothetical protein